MWKNIKGNIYVGFLKVFKQISFFFYYYKKTFITYKLSDYFFLLLSKKIKIV
jgi:hypothetical protein